MPGSCVSTSARPAEVRSAYRELTDRARGDRSPLRRIEGIQVQQQLTGGTEMIVGLSNDPVFGPVLLVGTGGVFAEVLRDVAVRPLPVDRRDVEEMVASLRGSALLDGRRGRPEGRRQGSRRRRPFGRVSWRRLAATGWPSST